MAAPVPLELTIRGTELRLASAQAIPYRLPFRRRYVTARGGLREREMVLLRLIDEDGVEGWGEAVPLSLRGGAGLDRVVEELGTWAAEAASRRAPDPGGLTAPARCAVATALADLEARRLRMPVWRLLGAGSARPVPCNATLVSGPPEEVAADAEDWAAEGFTTFKLKVGLLAEGPAGGSDPDLAQIRAVRAAVGPEARLRLDANGAWSVDRAEDLLRDAAPLGIELVEQPVAEIASMAELRRRLHARRAERVDVGTESEDGETAAIPIAADESVTGPEEAALARAAGACDLTTIKLSKVGALRPDLGGALPFYLSSALDGPIGIAAAAHAWQALSEAELAALPARPGDGPPEPLAQGLATRRLFAATIAARECELRGAELHLAPGPGLGVEIDAAALAAHRL